MSAPMENIAAHIQAIAEIARDLEGGEIATRLLWTWHHALAARNEPDTMVIRDPDDAICDGGGMGGFMAMNDETPS